eukprot:8264541-Pyramimonas_sp.AAC.1
MCHTVGWRVLLTVGDGGQLSKIEHNNRAQSPHRSQVVFNTDAFRQLLVDEKPEDQVGRIFLLRGCDGSEGAGRSC